LKEDDDLDIVGSNGLLSKKNKDKGLDG